MAAAECTINKQQGWQASFYGRYDFVFVLLYLFKINQRVLWYNLSPCLILTSKDSISYWPQTQSASMAYIFVFTCEQSITLSLVNKKKKRKNRLESTYLRWIYFAEKERLPHWAGKEFSKAFLSPVLRTHAGGLFETTCWISKICIWVTNVHQMNGQILFWLQHKFSSFCPSLCAEEPQIWKENYHMNLFKLRPLPFDCGHSFALSEVVFPVDSCVVKSCFTSRRHLSTLRWASYRNNTACRYS